MNDIDIELLAQHIAKVTRVVEALRREVLPTDGEVARDIEGDLPMTQEKMTRKLALDSANREELRDLMS